MEPVVDAAFMGGMMRKLAIAAGLLAAGGALVFQLSGGAGGMAVRSKPPKTALPGEGGLKAEAEALFHEVFSKGQYDRIGEVLVAQKAAYLDNPRDPQLALHIAHLHLWRIAERPRQGAAMLPSVTDDMTLARKYFTEAKKLAPDDARIDGWLGGATMGEGAIHGDERQVLEGYFLTKESARRYPAFNLFSFAFVLGNRPHDDPRFVEAIDAMFENMDITNHAPMDRSNPTIAGRLEVRANESDPAVRRAVGNTELTPHNVEGFFLAFGDMLVKQGDTRVARIIYENAKLNADYPKWPYRWLLEDRLENLEANVERFRAFQPTREALQSPDLARHSIVLNSYPCMICHQAE